MEVCQILANVVAYVGASIWSGSRSRNSFALVGSAEGLYRGSYVCSLICAVIFAGGYHNANAQVNKSPYEFTEIFRIGDEARGDTLLLVAHGSASIVVNSVGQIFYAGGGPPVVPVLSFTREGRFAGFVGAKGGGPGEFQRSNSTVIGPGDSIYVYDTEFRRLLVYEPNTLQHSFSVNLFDAQDIAFPSGLLGVSGKGYLFRYGTVHRPPGDSGYDPDEPRYDVVNWVSRRGNILESVAKLPAGERFIRTYGRSIRVGTFPFGRKPLFAFKDGLLYAGWNDTIDISVISGSGEVIRTIEKEHESVPVTREEINRILSNKSEEYRREILRSDVIPETKPAYDALVVDDNGHVWIRESPESIDSGSANWLILDSDGQLIGEMELSVNILLKEITGGRAYASVNSEMYGPYIVVYSVTEK